MTWLRFSSSIAADRSGASVFTWSARLVICTPSGELAAISLGELDGPLEQLVVVGQLAHQPAPVRLVGGHGPAGEHPVGRQARPDDAGQEVAHAHLGAGETDRDGRVAERGGRGADADVGRQAQREAATDCRPVDRGDDRLGQRSDRLRERGHRLLEAQAVDGGSGGVEHARPEVAQVDAGAEAPPGAGEHDDADVAVDA